MHHLKTLGKDFAKFQQVVVRVMTSHLLNDLGHVFAKSIYIARNLRFQMLGTRIFRSRICSIATMQVEHRAGTAYPPAVVHHLETLGKDFAKFQQVVVRVMTSISLNDLGHVFAKSIYIAMNLHFQLLGTRIFRSGTCSRIHSPVTTASDAQVQITNPPIAYNDHPLFPTSEYLTPKHTANSQT